MNTPASYSRSGPIGRVVMDDGKLNVMSVAMLAALHRAFDEAERDKTVVVLSGRGKAFSAGFDLKVFAAGTAEEIHTMTKSGADSRCGSSRFRRRWSPPATATPCRWARSC